METIRMYLDNMFTALPKTPDMERLKSQILETMEDKYHELRNGGKSENEAIGIVISEFGNIEELTREMHVEPAGDPSVPLATQPFISNRGEVEELLAFKRVQALLTAVAVMLFILSPVLLILSATFSSVSRLAALLGLAALLVFVAVGVGLLIYSDFKMSRFKHLEEGGVLSPDMEQIILNLQKEFAGTKMWLTVFGVVFCILAALCVIAPPMISDRENAAVLGVVALLCTVSVGVFMLVYSGTVQSGFDMLLRQEEYSPQNRKAEKTVAAIGGIWWPVIVCIYLFWSFRTGNWGFTWIIWPVAGVLFGAVSSIIGIRNRED